MKFRYREPHEMKDSGVEWLGMIPKEWGRTKLKNLVKIKITDGPHETPEFIDEGIPFLSAEAINIDKLNFDGKRGYISIEKHQEYCKKSKVLKNDILFCKSGSTTGKSALVETDEDFGIWSPLAIIRANNKIIHKGLFYFIQSRVFRTQVEVFWSFGTQPNIGMGTLENLFIAYGKDSQEQQLIVDFLDQKTAEFDNIIAKKQAFIDKLTEAKKSLISEVVTGKKKITVDSGKLIVENRKAEDMKDSGVEWLGMIPKEWGTSKIKYSTYVKGRIGWQGLKSDEFIDEGAFLVTGTDFKDNKINWYTCYHVSEERYHEAKPIQLKNNDLLITKDGTIGKIAIVENCPEQAVLNSGVFVTRCINNEYITRFMFYMLTSKVFDTYIDITKTGSTIQHLYQETFVNFSYTLTTMQEQKIIVDFLDEKTAKIDNTIEKIKVQIEKLKEAKQSLISEAVTGKIEVI